MLTGSRAGHAANAMFLSDKTMHRQKRGLKAIFARFPTAANIRHEATSRLADKLQMHELMKVTGHKTSRMVSRYYHPRAEDLARKLD